MGFIYKIINPNGRVYIGQTYSIIQRISDYRCLRYRSKKSIIIASVKKYGWGTHKMSIVEEVEDSRLDEREIYWIAEMKTLYPNNPNGMNLTIGGLGCRQSWKHDAERVAKAKLRCGVNAANYGKKVSEEVKKRISESVSKYNKSMGVKPSQKCHELALKARSTPIVCYNLKGEFIAEFESVKKASVYFQIPRRTLNDAYLGNQCHAYGIIVRKKENDYPLTIEAPKKILVRKLCRQAV